MTTLADAQTTKLTVAPDGTVWYAQGSRLPRASGLRPEELVERVGREHCRVSGTRENASLLLALFQARRNGLLSGLEVCSPLCCEPADTRRDPEVFLHRMRSFDVPSSLGGWHEFTNQDAISYLLATYIDRRGGAGPVELQLLLAHAAWPALSFVHCLGRTAACNLLAEVLDPRWYIDLGDPDRTAKLEQYLGLNPVSMDQSTVKRRRRDLVLACWRGDQVPGRHDVALPGQFLWRYWYAKGGGPKADLSTCKLFVAYLRSAWADAVCASPHAGHLFVPRHFFATPEDAVAYRYHTQRAVPDA